MATNEKNMGNQGQNKPEQAGRDQGMGTTGSQQDQTRKGRLEEENELNERKNAGDTQAEKGNTSNPTGQRTGQEQGRTGQGTNTQGKDL